MPLLCDWRIIQGASIQSSHNAARHTTVIYMEIQLILRLSTAFLLETTWLFSCYTWLNINPATIGSSKIEIKNQTPNDLPLLFAEFPTRNEPPSQNAKNNKAAII